MATAAEREGELMASKPLRGDLTEGPVLRTLAGLLPPFAGHITLDDLRACWMPISPWPFVTHVRERDSLLVYARYDTTFPVDLSRLFVGEFRRQGATFASAVLPCGHYTTGKTPFKFLDGYALTKFFLKRL